MLRYAFGVLAVLLLATATAESRCRVFRNRVQMWHYAPPSQPIVISQPIVQPPPDDGPPPAKKQPEVAATQQQEEQLDNRAKIEIRVLPGAELFCYDTRINDWMSMGREKAIQVLTTPELQKDMAYTYKFKMVTTGPKSIERTVTVRFQAGDEGLVALDSPLSKE